MTREEQNARRDAMKAYKAEGHTAKEVAQKFNVSEGTAYYICAGIGNQSSRGWFGKGKTGRPKHYRNQYVGESWDDIERRATEMVEMYAPAFEYVGNYTGSDGFADVRCNVCGTVQAKSMVALRHRHARCDACYRRELEAARAEKQAKRRSKAEARRAEKVKEKKPKAYLPKQIQMKQCKECGGLFVPHNGTLYCSEACRKKAANRLADRKKDTRLKGKIVDRNIDLRELARRDNNVCALCGKTVDWEDFERRGEAIIAGNNYPSIDHIVPVSKGGLHSWENVQLAHRICNTMKGNTPLVGGVF